MKYMESLAASVAGFTSAHSPSFCARDRSFRSTHAANTHCMERQRNIANAFILREIMLH